MGVTLAAVDDGVVVGNLDAHMDLVFVRPRGRHAVIGENAPKPDWWNVEPHACPTCAGLDYGYCSDVCKSLALPTTVPSWIELGEN